MRRCKLTHVAEVVPQSDPLIPGTVWGSFSRAQQRHLAQKDALDENRRVPAEFALTMTVKLLTERHADGTWRAPPAMAALDQNKKRPYKRLATRALFGAPSWVVDGCLLLILFSIALWAIIVRPRPNASLVILLVVLAILFR